MRKLVNRKWEVFHCFCEALLVRIIGRFPDTDILQKEWRSQTEDVKNTFQKKEEEEQRYLKTMFLAWEESQELERIVSTFDSWEEEEEEEVTKKSVK